MSVYLFLWYHLCIKIKIVLYYFHKGNSWSKYPIMYATFFVYLTFLFVCFTYLFFNFLFLPSVLLHEFAFIRELIKYVSLSTFIRFSFSLLLLLFFLLHFACVCVLVLLWHSASNLQLFCSSPVGHFIYLPFHFLASCEFYILPASSRSPLCLFFSVCLHGNIAP